VGFVRADVPVINTKFADPDDHHPERRMSLVSFHKVLITTAILFCAGYAAWEINRYSNDGSGSLILGVVFGVIAVLLAFYLAHLRRFLGDQKPR
jgi:uncharacterized membrane protein